MAEQYKAAVLKRLKHLVAGSNTVTGLSLFWENKLSLLPLPNQPVLQHELQLEPYRATQHARS